MVATCKQWPIVTPDKAVTGYRHSDNVKNNIFWNQMRGHKTKPCAWSRRSNPTSNFHNHNKPMGGFTGIALSMCRCLAPIAPHAPFVRIIDVAVSPVFVDSHSQSGVGIRVFLPPLINILSPILSLCDYGIRVRFYVYWDLDSTF